MRYSYRIQEILSKPLIDPRNQWRILLDGPSEHADKNARASGIAGDKVASLRERSAGLADRLPEEGFDQLHLELPLQKIEES